MYTNPLKMLTRSWLWWTAPCRVAHLWKERGGRLQWWETFYLKCESNTVWAIYRRQCNNLSLTTYTHLLTIWFEEFLGMQVALQHSLIKQHIAHGLRDDDVHLFRQSDLFHLSWDYYHTFCQPVTVHQNLHNTHKHSFACLNKDKEMESFYMPIY